MNAIISRLSTYVTKRLIMSRCVQVPVQPLMRSPSPALCSPAFDRLLRLAARCARRWVIVALGYDRPPRRSAILNARCRYGLCHSGAWPPWLFWHSTIPIFTAVHVVGHAVVHAVVPASAHAVMHVAVHAVAHAFVHAAVHTEHAAVHVTMHIVVHATVHVSCMLPCMLSCLLMCMLS